MPVPVCSTELVEACFGKKLDQRVQHRFSFRLGTTTIQHSKAAGVKPKKRS